MLFLLDGTVCASNQVCFPPIAGSISIYAKSFSGDLKASRVHPVSSPVVCLCIEHSFSSSCVQFDVFVHIIDEKTRIELYLWLWATCPKEALSRGLLPVLAYMLRPLVLTDWKVIFYKLRQLNA